MTRASADHVLDARRAHTFAPVPRVRRASVDDAARVAAVGARLFLQAYDGQMDPEDIGDYLRLTYGPPQQTVELQDPDTAVWLAEAADGQTAGYAMLRRRPVPVPVAGVVPRAGDDVELARIYVDREWQGHRFGATLLAACVSEARAWGGAMLWLSVWQRNARALAFYQRLGLRIVGENDFVVGRDRQRDHIMVLPLR